MFSALKSRKFWAGIAGAAIAAFGSQLGLAPEIVTKVVAIIGTYIVGQGIADAGAAGKSQGK